MDKYIRARAELDNVKKRGQRDLENARKYALEGFVKELLEVRDSLELGLAHAQGDDNDAQELKQGGELTLRKLSQVMEKFNIVQLDPKGEPFDPALHEAMTITPTDEVAPNHIAIVAQKGYQLHDRLIRPARVVVAQAPPQEQSPDAGA